MSIRVTETPRLNVEVSKLPKMSNNAPRTIKLTTTYGVECAISNLLLSGLYGKTFEECAERMLCAGIRQAMKEGIV